MKIRVVGLLAGVLLGLAVNVYGQTAYFEVRDGIWENPANWSTHAVPGVTNTVNVTFEGRTVRITQPGALCTNLVAGYNGGETGTVCLATGTLYTVTSQSIGRSGVGTFIQTAGTTNLFGGSLMVGEQTAGNGRYELQGGYLNTNSSSTEVIGKGGRGTFVQSEGTTNRVGTYLTVGEATTGNGRYELKGGYLGTLGSATEMTVGYNGPGVFYQTGGTLDEVGIDKYLYVGRTATGNGTYVLNGGEILFTNRTYVAVGYNGVGSFILSNGVANVAKIFNVGKEAGGLGTCRLVNGSINAYQFTMGEKATASGTAYIEGGTLAAGIAVDVGYNGTGTVWQSGGVVTVTNQYVFIGRAAGSKGTYVMTGGDLALTNAGNHMYVGENGNGTLLQSNGAVRVKNWCTVSRQTGSVGLYRIVGGVLNVGGQLQISQYANSNARFEVVGTNSAISYNSFAMTTNAVLRFEIASNGVSKIAVQNNAALAGKLEVAVQQKLFNQPVTIMTVGSKSGTFNSVVPVFPLRAVDISYPSGAGNVVLSNFRYYTGTLIAVH